MKKINWIFNKEYSCFVQNLGLILMLVLHVFGLYRESLGPIEYAVWSYSNLCVCFFSFVSGYGTFYNASISSLTLKKNLLKFKKLYIKYICILCLFIPVYVLYADWNIVDFIKHIFLISHNYSPIYWYLKFYLLIMIFSVWIARFSSKTLLFCLFLSLFCSVLFSSLPNPPSSLFVYSYQFAAFCCGGLFFLNQNTLRQLSYLLLYILVVSSLYLVGSLTVNIWQFNLFLMLLTILVLGLIPIPKFLVGAIFKRNHNTNIWLIHGNVLLLLLSVHNSWNMYGLLFLVFIGSFLISYLVNLLLGIWHVEKKSFN